MKMLRISSGKRNLLDIVIIICLAVLLVAGAILLPYAAQSAAIYPDLTPEGLYTLTKAMEEELSAVTEEIELILCTDPDYLMASETTRAVYIMCQKLARQFPNISLRHIDVINDPGVADPYKQSSATEIEWDDLIIVCGKQYKIYSADAFFGMENGAPITFNGEYRLASIILSLTAHPTGAYAYFAVGHGERFFTESTDGSDAELSAFAELLGSLGIGTRTLSLDTDEIPEDCVLLILCGTTEDYKGRDMYEFSSRSPIEKLDEYLSSRRTLMVLRDALTPSMQNLDELLGEWGIRIESSLVTAPDSTLGGDRLIATYPKNEEGMGEIGYSMIAAIADMLSPPKVIIERAAAISYTRADRTVTIAQNISRIVDPLFLSGEDAKATDALGMTIPTEGAIPLAALGVEAHLGNNGEYTYSYLLAAGTTELITNTYLSNSAYGNGDVMYAVLRTVTRTDKYASSAVGGLDINSENYGGKTLADTDIYTEDQPYYLTATGVRATLGMTGGRLILCILITLLPVLAVPVAAFIVLRRRRGR